ncbi:3-keto-disaccharide hydrolase [Flectobacillus roseus]|uniref:DUF1080 domain-containing protein n=1 Tax=Flectobacillus roseus TaxID=502259 RepID=A0ABT6YDN0_9BACT|nr:DUF1080 domain-containing protein [Flectobacillus roseus]MDI9861694.1 DUF1080 domain-containing protein [Flectobacillus roseus]
MKNFFIKSVATLGIATLGLSSFVGTNNEPNQLSEQEKKEGWTLLFDGKTTNGWHLYNKGKIPTAWIIQNNELYCKPDTFTVEHGDLVTDKEYQNFDLRFEWKITVGGNSGVFFNVVEKESNPTAWSTGPEYQLLDTKHDDYEANFKKRAGCLYGFFPQKNAAVTKPAGEWNESRIKQVNGKIEFYLNGVLTAEQDLTSKDWKDLVAKSNFKYFSTFGKTVKGRIALQDWSKGIAFKNIKIKEL